MHKHPRVLLLLAATLPVLASAAPDPLLARHAAVLAEGEKIAERFLAIDARREAYDRATAGDPAQAAKVAKAAAALTADNARHAEAAKALAADVKAHNASCRANAAPAAKHKTKEARDAAIAAENARVAACDANAGRLDERGRALDAAGEALVRRHKALEAEVAAGNASIDEQEKLGRALADEQYAIEEAAEAWLGRLNAVVADSEFRARSAKIAACKARREMVVSAKDLESLVAQQKACARELAR